MGTLLLLLGVFSVVVIWDRSGWPSALSAGVVGSGVFVGTLWQRSRVERRAIERLEQEGKIGELHDQFDRRLRSPVLGVATAVGALVGVQVAAAIGSTAWIMWLVAIVCLFGSAILLGRQRLWEYLAER